MASRVGVIEFVFKDNGDRNVVVVLPALVCEDFDTDLVILSGPMLNSVNIGIGPTTNYLISLDGKDAGSVPVTLTDDVQAVPIDKTSNGPGASLGTQIQVDPRMHPLCFVCFRVLSPLVDPRLRSACGRHALDGQHGPAQ